MRLEQSTLDRYKGGQVEIRNGLEEYLYRGEVADVYIDGSTFHIRFAWLARAKDYPTGSQWVNDPDRDYAASLEIYTVSAADDTIVLNGWVTKERAVLFQPGAGKPLDPYVVEGLTL